MKNVVLIKFKSQGRYILYSELKYIIESYNIFVMLAILERFFMLPINLQINFC